MADRKVQKGAAMMSEVKVVAVATFVAVIARLMSAVTGNMKLDLWVLLH